MINFIYAFILLKEFLRVYAVDFQRVRLLERALFVGTSQFIILTPSPFELARFVGTSLENSISGLPVSVSVIRMLNEFVDQKIIHCIL